MNKLTISCAAAVALASSAAHSAAPPAIGQEARIPFVNRGAVRDFRVEGRDTVYLRAQRGRWYRATFFGKCFGLPFAQTIGIDTAGRSVLDRYGALIVSGERCQFQSLVRVEAPPPRRPRKARREA